MRFWLVLATLAIGWAQPPATGARALIGEVSGIDAPANQIRLKADNGAVYAVQMADKTVFLRVPPGEKDLKKAVKIALADIGVGDRLLARGPVSEAEKSVTATTIVVMSKADLAKKHEQDRAEWQHRGVSGVVETINPDSKELVVKLRGRDAKTVAVDASSAAGFRRYAPDSVRYADAKPSALGEVQPGDNIRVLGEKTEDGARIKAEEVVFGAFQTIAATVVSVDAAGGVVELKDLQTKKPVTVRVSPDTLVRRLPAAMATMMAQRTRGGPAPTGLPPSAPGPSAPPGGGQRPEGNGRGSGNFDLQQMLERMPALALTELHAGDAVIVSSSKSNDSSRITAITLLAGVEPFLAAAPRTAGQINLGAWNLDGGIPEQ